MYEQRKRDRMSREVGRHLDRAARGALAPPPQQRDDSVTQLESVAVAAWHNLVGEDGFLPVLLLLFLAMISAPLIGNSEIGMVATVLIGAVALVFTVFRSTHRRRVRRITLVYSVVASAATIAALTAKGADAIQYHHMVVVVLTLNLAVLVTAFPLVLIRSFQHRRVTVNTVCATLSAYLLIGLIFTGIYRLSGQLAPPFFTQFAGGGEPTPGEYAYFSFITLTTVGFGDFTAASDPGRAFVMVEAVLGQVFLVTMLARVVGMLGVQRDIPDELAMAGSDDEQARAAAEELAHLARDADREEPEPG
jgi:hypothetical protein